MATHGHPFLEDELNEVTPERILQFCQDHFGKKVIIEMKNSKTHSSKLLKASHVGDAWCDRSSEVQIDEVESLRLDWGNYDPTLIKNIFKENLNKPAVLEFLDGTNRLTGKIGICGNPYDEEDDPFLEDKGLSSKLFVSLYFFAAKPSGEEQMIHLTDHDLPSLKEIKIL